ncbi:TraE/TraK family type IV conjugative transfer system protein [Paraburkholderia madseniana]|uniref:TraE/TraK family type IV conjugative transfer system protein n=1 Tax=Paraburkholderia madseniana TaxID=2599607 RepID=UPI0027F78141|nr:type IV conjugative transfer system protein TraE [Paraburkholderia madseniana]
MGEYRSNNRLLTVAVTCACVGFLLLAAKVTFMSEIVVNQVPGMPDGAKIWRNGMDEGAVEAQAFAVANALASVNPSNAESVKKFVQPFLSPDAYTVVSKAIDNKAAQLAQQHELGSYYLVLGARPFYHDDKLGRVFVSGELHTVNAARDTSEPWVFEFPVRFANYRMWFDGVTAYVGDKIHNSDWIEAQNKK